MSLLLEGRRLVLGQPSGVPRAEDAVDPLLGGGPWGMCSLRQPIGNRVCEEQVQ